MTIKYNTRTLLALFITLVTLAIVFLILFCINFKFTKKLPCLVINENNFTYLIVDKKVDDYLNTFTGKQKKVKLEFEKKIYNLICQKLKPYNDQYIYETNLDLKLTSNNIAYFYVNNLNIKNFLS